MQLTLSGISQRVGAQTWLYDMSLAPTPGAVTVLLGATQAGKTTLMRLMAGLDVPSSGSVLVDGHDVTGTPVRERNVAMVYQQFINYPSMTVYDNIASPLKLGGRPKAEIDRRVRELAAKLHIEVFLDRLPAELSGGQQQRVAIARALVSDPQLIVADEPTGDLDRVTGGEVLSLLADLHRQLGKTIVMVTHDPKAAERAERLVHLEKGVLVAGTAFGH
jgi:glycerol transport system ATP-binding protein